MYRYGGSPSQPVTVSSTGGSLGVSGEGLSLSLPKSTFTSHARNSKSFSIAYFSCTISSKPLLMRIAFTFSFSRRGQRSYRAFASSIVSADMISCAHNIAIIRTILSILCVILCINNLAHFKQALLEHLVFFLQCRHRLRQLVLCFLLFACFFLRSQLFSGVADVLLDGHFLHPFLLRRYAGTVNDFLYIPAAVRIFGHGLPVPLLLHAFYGGVGDFFGVSCQVAQRQVRVFHDRAGLVNDLHGSKPPFSGHTVPDVHIVGGGLHGAAASVDGIGLGRIQTELVRMITAAVRARVCEVVADSECTGYLMFIIAYICDKRACDVGQTGSHRGACRVGAGCTHQHPLGRDLLPAAAKQCGGAGGVGALVDAAHRVRVRGSTACQMQCAVRICREVATQLDTAQRGCGSNGKLDVFQRVTNSLCVSRSALNAQRLVGAHDGLSPVRAVFGRSGKVSRFLCVCQRRLCAFGCAGGESLGRAFALCSCCGLFRRSAGCSGGGLSGLQSGLLLSRHFLGVLLDVLHALCDVLADFHAALRGANPRDCFVKGLVHRSLLSQPLSARLRS
nr:MAG TPA: hypothetical protein [Caudoviricetes sp.]